MPSLETLARAAMEEEVAAPPPVDQLRRRGTRRRRSVAGLATMTIAVVVAGVVLAAQDQNDAKVFVGPGEPSTTTTTTPIRSLRLKPTVLPSGFVENPGLSRSFKVSFNPGRGTDPASITVKVDSLRSLRTEALPSEVVQFAVYSNGTVGQSDYGALAVVVWVPTEGEVKSTGKQRQVGARLVTLSERRVPGEGSLPSVDATSASWREAEYAVLVLGIRVPDTDLETFIGGLNAQRGPGREFIPTNAPISDPSQDPAMRFAEETGWMPVACPSHIHDAVGPDNGVCGYIYEAELRTGQELDVVDAHGNLVGHMGRPGGFVPLKD